MRIFKPKPPDPNTKRGKEYIEMQKKEVATRIKGLQSRKEKIALVKENNPLFYVFGQTLVQRKPYEGYDEYINRLYIGDKHGNKKTSN
jgi:chaperonin cofactor prefoldin